MTIMVHLNHPCREIDVAHPADKHEDDFRGQGYVTLEELRRYPALMKVAYLADILLATLAEFDSDPAACSEAVHYLQDALEEVDRLSPAPEWED